MTSTIKVNNIQNQCGANIANKCGSTVTLGASGDTITLACGASQTGFGRTGTVDWDTTAKTASFTAVSGTGYFVDTSGGAVTMTLPASPSAGDIVSVADYTRTFATNNLTIGRNSQPIAGIPGDSILNVDGQSATFIYVDGTEGWVNVQETQTSQTGIAPFIIATGGTITTCGNCKIHTFTSPGTFTVCNAAGICAPTRNQVSYMVVAGGGGGGNGDNGGGGGAGGFREQKAPLTPYTASPLDGAGSITVTATAFPITVGGGGAGGSGPSVCGAKGGLGSNSIFSTKTSAGGGGGGGGRPSTAPGLSGGSGGGAGHESTGGRGSGNTPPTTPAQGNDGGNGSGVVGPQYGGGGGGGASAVGSTGSSSSGGAGGNGVASSITGSSVTRSGGGGGGAESIAGSGGTGGGGNGRGNCTSGDNGTDNTGGGGGSTGGTGCAVTGGNGGSGIVIIRYKYQ